MSKTTKKPKVWTEVKGSRKEIPHSVSVHAKGQYAYFQARFLVLEERWVGKVHEFRNREVNTAPVYLNDRPDLYAHALVAARVLVDLEAAAFGRDGGCKITMDWAKKVRLEEVE